MLRFIFLTLALLYPGAALAIHQEAHCGKEWITFSVVAYKVADGKLKESPNRVYTIRKSDIEFLFSMGGKEPGKVLVKDGVAYYVPPDSLDAILRCLDSPPN